MQTLDRYSLPNLNYQLFLEYKKNNKNDKEKMINVVNKLKHKLLSSETKLMDIEIEKQIHNSYDDYGDIYCDCGECKFCITYQYESKYSYNKLILQYFSTKNLDNDTNDEDWEK